MSRYPLGFLSYARADDDYARGALTRFRERLEGEVSAQTGELFQIFQDRNIVWGDRWEERINDWIDAGFFLICIVTPSFFKSDPCRNELERFVAWEKTIGRSDLVLPVYYITCPQLEDKARREADPLAQLISTRNYVDWRQLRLESLDSLESKKMLAKLATDICVALQTRFPEGMVNNWGQKLHKDYFR